MEDDVDNSPEWTEPDVGRLYTVGASPKMVAGTGVSGLGALLVGLVAPDGAIVPGVNSVVQGLILAVAALIVTGVVTWVAPPGEVRRGPK